MKGKLLDEVKHLDNIEDSFASNIYFEVSDCPNKYFFLFVL